MTTLFLLASLALTVVADLPISRDAVVWNFGTPTWPEPPMEQMLSTATTERPLLVLLLPHMDMRDFSNAANINAAQPESTIPNMRAAMLKSSGYFGTVLEGDIDGGLEAAQDVLYYTEADDGAEIPASAIVVLKAPNFKALDAKAGEVLGLMKRGYRAVLMGEHGPQGSRLKREADAKEEKKADDVSVTPNPDGVRGTFFAGPNGCLANVGNATVVYVGGAKQWTAVAPIAEANLDNCNVTGGANNVTSTMVFTFGPSGDIASLVITMVFSTDPSTFWLLDSMSVNLNGVTTEVSAVNLNTMYLSSIIGTSYACTEFEPIWLLKDGKTKEDPKTHLYSIQIGDFQVEPFVRDGRKVFDATGNVDDCVPFFTPGIWMGIFTLIILGLTLIFGVTMIASLRTMDKFDDPKGKPLNINAKE